ncbi:MAG: bifunctional UDP-N-acetylglucosamine diphosphorylase/glucosamine-1-phosphate N-acetyltransferase GlmU [Mangrovicoccus sp.]
MGTALIILAAGQGSRMKSDLPKVLHNVAGSPLLSHVVDSGAVLEPEKLVIVAGHGAEAVRKAALDEAPEAQILLQEEQLGTAHAVLQAAPGLDGFDGDAVVLYGDTPFISAETMQAMVQARADGADIVILGFEAEDPGRYGRLIVENGDLQRIVEFKDASEAERDVRLCNSGVVMADAANLMTLVSEVGNDNAAGEYYLTDIVALGRTKGQTARVVTCPEAETMGVNTRADLARAEAAFQARKRAEALDNGVTIIDPDTVYFSRDTYIGRDAHIEPNVFFGPGVTVETGAKILAFCHLTDCHISRGAAVGPFARIRGGAELAEDVKIGNFVELKNAQLAEGVKISHLSYVGDAEIGEATNIGAGTITCNYDGVMKHRTVIGREAFIGSNTMLVAPVTIGDKAMTASGSVITMDVAPDALAIGRARQFMKPGFATKLMDKLRATKERRSQSKDKE